MGNSTGKIESYAPIPAAAKAHFKADAPPASAAAAAAAEDKAAAAAAEAAVAAKGSVVCEKAIEEIVGKFMANSSINSPLVPDFIERQIYRNALTLALGLAEEVLAGAKLEVLGHRVELRLVRG